MENSVGYWSGKALEATWGILKGKTRPLFFDSLIKSTYKLEATPFPQESSRKASVVRRLVLFLLGNQIIVDDLH